MSVGLFDAIIRTFYRGYGLGGPDLRWACVVRNQVRHSLHAPALYVESEPAWRQIRALGEAALLCSRM